MNYSHLTKPFQLGKATLPNRVFYSPLAGCSDFPFRKMSAKYNPGLMYCEMVKMDALVRNEQNTFRMLDYDLSMRPIGAQLCGSKLEYAAQSAKILEDLGFDVIDLNCGCPVDKVTKDGSGSGLLKNPEKIGDLVAAIVAAVKIPVTVKIRAGWDDDSIVVEEITEIVEKAGAFAIAVHARTRQQGYQGPARWEFIKRAVQARKNIPVIGNGDLFSPIAAEEMIKATGCDILLVSRGTMGSPWIAEDILDHFNGVSGKERNFLIRKESLLEHLDFAASYYEPKKAAIEMRKVGCWYIKDAGGARAFRNLVCKAETIDEMKQLIQQHPFTPE